jgi:hypothetical protein
MSDPTEYRVNGQLVGYVEGSVVTHKPDDDGSAGWRLHIVGGCLIDLGVSSRGFLLTLDGELPNLIWGADEELAAGDRVRCLRTLRTQIRNRYGRLSLPHDTVLLYRGAALRLFGSDHPGSIVTTVPAR